MPKCALQGIVFDSRCLNCLERQLRAVGRSKALGAKVLAAQEWMRKFIGDEMPTEAQVKARFAKVAT